MGGCSPLSVSFADATRGASASAVYSWDLGNGNVSTLKNPGAVYQEEKAYTVKLTVTDGGRSSVKSVTVTVYKKPTADFGPAQPKVCLPAPAVFISASTPGDGYIANYYWDFGNGTTQQGTSSQTSYNFNVVQKATVNLTVTNNFGCAATVTKTDIVEVLPEMRPSFTYDKALVCEITDAIAFNANATTGPGTLQYDWQFGDGNVDNIKNPAHVYNKKGLFTATLKISNEHGCQATTSRGQINVAYFNTDFNSSMLCRQVNFNGSSYLSPSATEWSFGDNTKAYSWSGATHTYITEGKYMVKLVNTYGVCKDSVSKEIDVKDNVNYNTTINVPAAVCIGSNVQFSSSSSVNPSSRVWNFGDAPHTSSAASPNYVYSQPGTYTVKLVNTFGTCKEEETRQIVVNSLPAIQPFDVKFGGLCGAPVTVTFKDNTPDAVAWSWRINYRYDNSQNGYVYVPSSLQDPSYNYTSDGSYSVDVTVSNAAGCTAYTGKMIVVTRPSVVINTVSTSYPGGINNCDDVKQKFRFTSSEAVSSFKWDFGNGNTSTDLQPEFLFTKDGRSPISLSYTTINGCTGTVNASSEMVYRKPKADFSYTPAPCADKVLVNFNSSSYPNTHFAWNFGSGYSQTVSSTYGFNFPDTGYYLVKHIGFNGGCSDTIEKTIYTGILPKFINITSVSPQLCTGTRGEITFNQSSLRATGLLWDFGDGTIPYDTSNHNVKHTYTRSGRYNISLTANSDGCPLQRNSNVTILLKQNPALTVNTSSICSNQSVTASISGMETNPYTANSSWDQEHYQYSILRFEYDDGTPFTGFSNSTFSYTSYSGNLSGLKVGDIRVRAIIRNNYLSCTDTSNYVSIKVNGPKADIKVSTNNVCWKSPLVFQDLSTAPTNTPIVSWRWNYGDGGSDVKANGNQVSHTYTNPGTYSASLTVTDALGCTSTSASVPALVRGPKVSFSPSATYPLPNVPLNTTVTFNNTTNESNSPGISYVWDYGNSITGIQRNGQQTYPVAGDYTIKLTAKDPVTGCSDEASTFITVRDFNTAFKINTVYLGATGSCLPVQLRITNTSSNVTSYSWDFGDGTRLEGPSSPSHTYTTPGKKVIILYSKGYNNLNGIFKDSIYIEESSATMIADVLKGCTGQQVSLSAQALNTSSYLWDFGDGTIKQTTTDPYYKHTYLSPGVFTPKVIVKDAKGCGNTAGIAEKIIIDSLSVSISSISDHLCQYTDNIFTPAIYSLAESYAGEKLTYKWDYGTGNSADNSFAREGAFRYDTHGPVTIRLTVNSPYGCTKVASRQAEVHEKFGLQIYAPSKLDVCKNSKVQIVATGAYSYEWINHTDDLSSTEIGNPFASPPSDTTYTVAGFDRWKCSSDTTQIKVTVRPLPTVVASPDAEVVANTEHQLFATGSNDVVHYVWSPATYLNCINCTSPVVKPKKSTSYVVKVRTAYNCVSTDTVNIKLQCLNGFIYIPNSFTPNLDGKNEMFYIKGKGIGIIKSFRIFNRWGDMVFERKNFEIDDRSVGWDGRKNGNPVPVGTYVYMAELQCENGGDIIIKKGTVTVLY